MSHEKEANFASAVVYLRNSAGLVAPFLQWVCGELGAHFARYEVILVNDASQDDSAGQVRRFAAENHPGGPITLVNMSLCQGPEMCMNAGLDLCIGDFIFEFDTMDLPPLAGHLVKAYQAALTGYDIVSVRPQKGRALSSRLFYRLFNRFSGAAYKLDTDYFRVLSRRALNRVHAISATPAYRKAAYAASGLKLLALEAPGGHRPAQSDRPARFSLAMNSLVLYTNAGYRLSAGISALMLLGTLAELCYTLAIYLGGGRPIEGWTTTMLVLTAGFFGVFLILALVLKYLSLLVDLIFRQQKYLVEGIEKL